MEVIKSSVDQIGNLTDHASEGTNRISASKLHRSQLSAQTRATAQGGTVVRGSGLVQNEPEVRRSVEIQNFRLKKGASDSRK